ncbi:hypothetical protein [Mycobacterium sp. 1482292.6]|uniref:hypothetical protein n=1 Tax=Mycobacterium sp. 1482292.6 TaxID=1834081 RepID=UPI0012EA35CC|nr:hypothetical protein [Mycobacterium sp. 1482292.6]
MSRGFGKLQRRVLNGLLSRRSYDRYPLTQQYPYDHLFDESAVPRAARARWRWYTVDLLDLVPSGATRSDRVSLHRAIHGIADRGLVEVADRMPYGQPFAPYLEYGGLAVGGVDLNELNSVDDRWPRHPGRALWFRLSLPDDLDDIPRDDQILILGDIAEFRPDPFLDFVEAIDHEKRWATPMGQFLVWLFCGPKEFGG